MKKPMDSNGLVEWQESGRNMKLKEIYDNI
jgi:hypothetical protein